MSAPLAEALVAAQRRALAALEKAYVADKLDAETVRDKLVMIGLPDEVDADRLLSALDLIREHGAALPGEPTNGAAAEKATPETKPATDAQLALIARLVKEKNVPPPDFPLTQAQAHAIIDTIKAGTYDAVKWSVPF